MGGRSLVDGAHAAWFECSSAGAQHALFYRMVALRHLASARNRSVLVGRTTDLVIDGVQRSANGFAAGSFLAVQQRPLNVAHHLHSGEQVVRAVRRQIPVILLIREPAACALAIVGTWPYVSVGQALRAYIRYYERVASEGDKCVIGLFDEVTADVGQVIERLNDRFGTSFDVPHHTEESARALYNPSDPSIMSRKANARAAEPQLAEPANHALLLRGRRLWDYFRKVREEDTS